MVSIYFLQSNYSLSDASMASLDVSHSLVSHFLQYQMGGNRGQIAEDIQHQLHSVSVVLPCCWKLDT